MKTIDIHSHITWNVDDGIQTKDETIKALQMAKNDGIEHIVLTPHFIPGKLDERDFYQMTLTMSECIEEAKKVDIHAYFGSEIFLNEDYIELIESKFFHSINHTKYILVEFDIRKEITDQSTDQLYELILRGYTPIIAHVERYFRQSIDINRIKEWKKMGCVIQINRTSLMSKDRKNTIKLIRHNLVHIIATDTHSTVGKRISQMSDVVKFIEKKFGQTTAELLCRKNALHIINNEPVEDTNIKKLYFLNY